jgi:hypothetical protein
MTRPGRLLKIEYHPMLPALDEREQQIVMASAVRTMLDVIRARQSAYVEEVVFRRVEK